MFEIKGLSFAKNNTTPWCFGSALRVLEPPVPRNGLFAFPGSGSTWLRYLIQKSTGYITGDDRHFFTNKASVNRFLQENDYYKNGYPGELISDGSAIGKKPAFK